MDDPALVKAEENAPAIDPDAVEFVTPVAIVGSVAVKIVVPPTLMSNCIGWVPPGAVATAQIGTSVSTVVLGQ